MPLQKIKRRIRNGDFGRFRFINLAIVFVCVLAGYLIAVISGSTQEMFQEFKEMESVVSDIGKTKNIDELERKLENNPKILEKMRFSVIKKIQSSPFLMKKVKKTLKELE